MLKHTKIVATISDQRCDVEFIKALYEAGMNVVRLNTAHMTEEGLSKVVNNVRAVSQRIGILMDTKGPEVRTTVAVNKEPIPFKSGDKVKISGDPTQETSHDHIYVSYPRFVHDLSVGSDILIDDGDLELKVVEKNNDYLLCEAQNEATLGSRKSVNVPGVRINLPSLTEKDRNNIRWAIEHDLDFIAHSFVRSKQDVLDIQRILDEHCSPIKIIAKIENQEGVDKIDEILEVAYGIMIARGDLGIEVPAEKIPGIQRVLIRKCVEVKKPVIVATQMLHSMINNPRPTRAEVTDIANAIYYRTDALMLSGETAYGKYPVEAVQTMTKVAREAEKPNWPPMIFVFRSKGTTWMLPLSWQNKRWNRQPNCMSRRLLPIVIPVVRLVTWQPSAEHRQCSPSVTTNVSCECFHSRMACGLFTNHGTTAAAGISMMP